MSIARALTTRRPDLGLAVLRLIAGIIFAVHGGQKLFVYGLDGVAGSFGQMGIPMAGILGPFVAFLEFFGGLALIAGLGTRLVAIGLSGVMVVAMLTVHLANGFFNPGGIEFPLSLFGAAVTLALSGAGAYSVDALLGRGKRALEPAAVPQPARRAA